jgi:SAM-dependent methyltransferase
MFDPNRYSAGVEVDKCRSRLEKFCRGDGLDIGCGGTNSDARFYLENKIVPTAIGVDLARTNLSGNATKLYWFVDGCMDYIFSSHLLEHLLHPAKALDEWFRVLKEGGHLVLYLPLEGYYPSVGKKGANKDHKHNLDPLKVLKWVDSIKIKYEIVVIEKRVEDNEYSFDMVLKKVK